MVKKRKITFFVLYLLISGVILNERNDPWSGIPVRRSPNASELLSSPPIPPPTTTLPTETTSLPSTTTTPITNLPTANQLPDVGTSMNSSAGKLPTSSEEDGYSPFSDFDIEWDLFDVSQKEEVNRNGGVVDLPPSYPILVWSNLTLKLIWPAIFFFAFLILCVCLALVCCFSRRQVFCCGLPLFDSTREAATNYDRASMRKENRRRNRQGLPDERLPLEDHELRRLASMVLTDNRQRPAQESLPSPVPDNNKTASPYETVEVPPTGSFSSSPSSVMHHVQSRPGSCHQEHRLLAEGSVPANEDFV